MPYIISQDHLRSIAGRGTVLMPSLAEWINKICPTYEIDTPREFAHFLAQACHETAGFRTLREYGPDKYFARYEGRTDLGNTRSGDGLRFKGRGIFQTTGRANYTQLGIIMGKRDLFVNNPALLEEPQHAVWSACEFWKTRQLNDAASYPDTARLKKKYRGRIIEVPPVEYISLKINGGYNGMDDRKLLYKRARQVLV